MYQYEWDKETGGLLLKTGQSKLSNEPRPVYYRELDSLGFDTHWNYPKDDRAPLLWAEFNHYIYRGKRVASTKGGSLYTKPELCIEKDAEGLTLSFVDVEEMCRRNAVLMETLAQETVQKIYNTYLRYKDKIDVFYVAFSGGKDSVAALDLVQRALPRDGFLVLFGDTGMEFPDTYDTVALVKADCAKRGITFLESSSEKSPLETWCKFGPPATVTRWCCSVHKTAPQILLLRQRLQKPDFRGMAFVGVRADESLARSKYDYVSYGGKHRGQYSCNVILDWNSAEIFLYLYQRGLVVNETYKKGNRRAGCLICPRAAERNDYMNHHCYTEQAEPLVDCIRTAYQGTFSSQEALEQFIENGGWKARKNGRDLCIPVNYTERTTKDGSITLCVTNARTNWREWIKTIGVLSNEASPYIIQFQNSLLPFVVEETASGITVEVAGETVKRHPEFAKYLKNVFRKTACCIGCRVCEADCPYGCIEFENGTISISQRCHHCAQCHKVEKGCLVYKSLEQPKGGITMSGKSMSLNSYSHHAPKPDWMSQYFKYQNTFDENHTLGSQMYNFFKRFLRDARLLDETGFSETAQIVDKIGLEQQASWGIIFTNLCYAPQVRWFVKNVKFNEAYDKKYLASMMVEAGAKESWTNDIFNSLTRMTELPLGALGLGHVEKDKNRVSITRTQWQNPVSEVVLYALYRFAEACGGYYQFSLKKLLDDTIERDGVSPTRIFGLDRDTMVPILNGLTGNYPDFLSASFTLDLDNITLYEEKTATDVLKLF